MRSCREGAPPQRRWRKTHHPARRAAAAAMAASRHPREVHPAVTLATSRRPSASPVLPRGRAPTRRSRKSPPPRAPGTAAVIAASHRPLSGVFFVVMAAVFQQGRVAAPETVVVESQPSIRRCAHPIHGRPPHFDFPRPPARELPAPGSGGGGSPLPPGEGPINERLYPTLALRHSPPTGFALT